MFGDFYESINILKHGGELIVCRRPEPGSKILPDMYAPWKYCYGFYLKDKLWRHVKNCKYKGLANEPEFNESLRKVQEESDILLYGQKDNSFLELEESVLRKMRKETIAQVVCSDELIKSNGDFLLMGTKHVRTWKWWVVTDDNTRDTKFAYMAQKLFLKPITNLLTRGFTFLMVLSNTKIENICATINLILTWTLNEHFLPLVMVNLHMKV